MLFGAIFDVVCSFQMTVESNYVIVIVIVIATLSNWLKRVAPVFQPMRSKNQNQSHHVRVIFPALQASYR